MRRHSPGFLLLLALALVALRGACPAADPEPQETPIPPMTSRVPTIDRSGLPGYEDLRLEGGTPASIEEKYLQTLPLMRGDVVTSNVVFSDVPPDSKYALLGLGDVVSLALEGNFQLLNEQRNVLIARSQTTGSEAFFIPFVDLVGSARKSHTHTENVPSTTRVDLLTGVAKRTDRNVETDRYTAGPEIRQNLPSGGSITGDLTEGRTDTHTSSGDGSMVEQGYDAEAKVRFLQPLLRGGGFDVGTADLRRSRLSEMNEILAERVQQRDTVLRVIQQYFVILQTKQSLSVSRDAITERKRFLEETKVKYEVGRVAESEILRAEIQYLQELNTAIDRRQRLDNAKETLLVLLGLPLDTPISFVDITPELSARGRVDIPPVKDAVGEGLSNRMELMQADISVSLSEIGVQVARNDILPQLDFDAGYGRNDTGHYIRTANEMDDYEWDTGVTLRIPLQNIARREARRRASISLESAKTSRLSTERDLEGEVLRSHRAVLSTEANLTILKKTVEQARRNLELINGSFSVGFSTITEVRLAQDDLFSSETNYDNALLNYQTSLAQLYVALGRPLF